MRWNKISLLYNPQAGKLLRKPALLPAVAEELRSWGPLQLRPTTGPNTAGAIAATAIAEGCDLLVVLGGDGTVNEAAQGAVGKGVAFMVLPGGTANVLCSEMGLPSNPVKAARVLRESGVLETISVGVVDFAAGRRYFLAMAGAGLDALVVESVVPALKKATGKFAYWVAGFKMVARLLPAIATRTAADQEENGTFFLFSRVRNYGGDLEIARKVNLLHPGLEMVSFRGVHAVIYLPYLLAVLIRQPGLMPGITLRGVRQADCSAVATQVPLHVDGELIGRLPAKFSVLEAALPLLIPRRYVEWAKRQPWTTSPTP